MWRRRRRRPPARPRQRSLSALDENRSGGLPAVLVRTSRPERSQASPLPLRASPLLVSRLASAPIACGTVAKRAPLIVSVDCPDGGREAGARIDACGDRRVDTAGIAATSARAHD